MRNTTKLKAILQYYHFDLSMNDLGVMVLNLYHKDSGNAMTFEDTSYSKLITKAYSYMNKQLKEGTKKTK